MPAIHRAVWSRGGRDASAPRAGSTGSADEADAPGRVPTRRSFIVHYSFRITHYSLLYVEEELAGVGVGVGAVVYDGYADEADGAARVKGLVEDGTESLGEGVGCKRGVG